MVQLLESGDPLRSQVLDHGHDLKHVVQGNWWLAFDVALYDVGLFLRSVQLDVNPMLIGVALSQAPLLVLLQVEVPQIGVYLLHITAHVVLRELDLPVDLLDLLSFLRNLALDHLILFIGEIGLLDKKVGLVSSDGLSFHSGLEGSDLFLKFGDFDLFFKALKLD